MKSICRRLPFVTVLFPLIAIIWINGDSSGLPDYVQRSLRSRGQLSKAVDTLEDSSSLLGRKREDSLQILEDLPFHEEAKEVTIKEAPTVQVEKNVVVEKTTEKTPEKKVSLIKKSVSEEPVVMSGKPIEAPRQEEIKKLALEQEKLITQTEVGDEEVVFNFENADLSNLVSYMETLFEVKFISDDDISPMVKGGKAIKGNKISFKTQKSMTKPQAWNLFLTFMNMAGLSVVQDSNPRVYRIMATAAAKKAALQSFIGVDFELLPDNDTKIRYVYFVKDIPVNTLKNIIASLKSSAADALILQELKAFIITDSSYNIKSLMRIVRELDKVSMPQAMSVLKLRRVDASHVKKLYDSLVMPDPQRTGSRLFGPRRSATSVYFPENASMIVEPRTNSLILLGMRESIKKIEEFVIKHIDIDAGTPYSSLHVYSLKYADAAIVAEIMNDVTKFGQNAAAARVGGVRGEDKYIKKMTFTPEKTGNRLIIRGDYEDYLKAKEIIESLDEPQPQVAIEVLILSIGITDIRELGAQIRNSPHDADGTLRNDGLFRNKIAAQTSGIRLGGTPSRVIQNTSESGAKRLLGDLMSLVTGSAAGNTVLSLGSDFYGVWGIFSALKTVSNLQVISNPFLIATNKTKATVSLGEIRNVQTAIIEGQQSVPTYSDKEAKLEVEITPQINSDGMIVLQLKVSIVEFRDDSVAAIEASARTVKVIETSTIVADKEVLALGGLIKNKIENGLIKTPILGNIPILGWLFKNKKKSTIKEDLLILLSARIIDPRIKDDVDAFTEGHIGDYKSTVKQMRGVHLRRDPIDRAFFYDQKGTVSRKVDKLIFKRDKKKVKKKKIKKRKQVLSKKEKKKKKSKKKKEDFVIGSGEKPRKKRIRRNGRRGRRKKNMKVDVVAPSPQFPVPPPPPEKLPPKVSELAKIVEGSQHD